MAKRLSFKSNRWCVCLLWWSCVIFSAVYSGNNWGESHTTQLYKLGPHFVCHSWDFVLFNFVRLARCKSKYEDWYEISELSKIEYVKPCLKLVLTFRSFYEHHQHISHIYIYIILRLVSCSIRPKAKHATVPYFIANI